jgi:sterol desaturase/sphingolipid hydroxylase (fatty acid hydroxylase superfamily)
MRAPTLLSLSIGLIVLSAVFWLVERTRPAVPHQRRRGVDTRVDVAYWFFTPLVTRAVTRVSLGVVFLVIAWSQGHTLDELRQLATTRQTWASSLPLGVQVPLILLLADVLAYATHRLFHARWLWPFHAIHHSSTTVDWLSSVRLHPVNDVIARVVQVLPLYWMGLNAVALAAFVPFLTFYALLLHANVNWSFGPLRFVIASPVFHRWHHTSEEEGLDRNFAGLFPFIDLAFGTFYMPEGRQPRRFGILGGSVPDGLVKQLVYPFRRRPHSAAISYDPETGPPGG